MSEEEYYAFWEKTKRSRDQFFAHNDVNFQGKNIPIMPDLQMLSAVAKEMKLILLDIASSLEPNLNQAFSLLLAHDKAYDFIEGVSNEAKYLRKLVKLPA